MIRIDASKIKHGYRHGNVVGGRLDDFNIRMEYKREFIAKYVAERVQLAMQGYRPFAWHVDKLIPGTVNKEHDDGI